MVPPPSRFSERKRSSCLAACVNQKRVLMSCVTTICFVLPLLYIWQLSDQREQTTSTQPIVLQSSIKDSTPNMVVSTTASHTASRFTSSSPTTTANLLNEASAPQSSNATSAASTHPPHLQSLTSGVTLSSSLWRPQKRLAMIIQNKPSSNLLPLILHFSMVLGAGWPIVLFTTNETIQYYQSVDLPAPFQRAIEAGDIAILQVPTAINLDKLGDIDFLITRSWLWETLQPAEHVVIFSNDTIMCSNSAYKIEDFFGSDFVGAPTPDSTTAKDILHIGHDGKEEFEMLGRLSLRNAKLHRKIANENDAHTWWEDARIVGGDRHEEMWFTNMISRERGRVASMEDASKWAGGLRSLGAVDLRHVTGEKGRELDAWCPEWRLAID